MAAAGDDSGVAGKAPPAVGAPRLQPRELGRVLPGLAGTQRFEIRSHPRKFAEAEAGFLDHVEDRAIAAVHQAEFAAQHPSVFRELPLDDPERVGQRFLSVGDGGFIDGNAEHLGADPECHFAGERHDVLRQEEEPLQRLRPPCRGCRPQPPRRFAEIDEDRVRLAQRQIAVDENRDPAGRVDRQKRRLALFALRQVHRDLLAVEPKLQQRKRDLLRVWRREVVELHRLPPLLFLPGGKDIPNPCRCNLNPTECRRCKERTMGHMEESPLAVYQAHLEKGELAYQWSPEAQKAVFYPRVICPFTGSDRLEWRVSAGLGTVYATTVTHPREGAPYNVALIDCDEGFRLMSRVEDIAPDAVRIGMRVRFHVYRPSRDEPPYPVFVPVEKA